jgi:hypothetical protein
MPNGYGQIHLNGSTAYAHRVAWELAYGRVPTGVDVCHRCDNRRCVNPRHLFLGTRLDNVQDSITKLRHAHGPKNGHAKLTVAQVREIRAVRYYRGLQPALAKKYGVVQAVISLIRARKTWKYV